MCAHVQMQRNLDDLAVEYQEHRTSIAARVEELEAQLHQAQQEGHLQVQELQGKVAKLEQDNSSMLNKFISTWQT